MLHNSSFLLLSCLEICHLNSFQCIDKKCIWSLQFVTFVSVKGRENFWVECFQFSQEAVVMGRMLCSSWDSVSRILHIGHIGAQCQYEMLKEGQCHLIKMESLKRCQRPFLTVINELLPLEEGGTTHFTNCLYGDTKWAFIFIDAVFPVVSTLCIHCMESTGFTALWEMAPDSGPFVFMKWYA